MTEAHTNSVIKNIKYLLQIFQILIFVSSSSLYSQKNAYEPYLFVFVGEKISVNILKPEASDIDYSFKAKYKVLQNVYGNYTNDTIEFIVYDHRGLPKFSNFETVLLYVCRIGDGEWYHEKYLFQEVYKTTDGRWAGPYDKESYDYITSNTKINTTRPVRIHFKDRVSYDLFDTRGSMGYPFPKPYFKFRREKYIPVLGNYVEDLFLLKRNGILKARGYF